MKKAHNTQIHLDERLYLCAKNVRLGSTVADIGADHAYIAIWLILNDVCPRAIATDLRSGPLMNAQKNIFKYGVADKIETRLSDGLDAVFPAEVEDIIIAGMGGELIMQIIARAGWLRDPTKHLVLQPMSAEVELREFLASQKFKIVSEQAVVSCGKVYTVMSVFFDDNFSRGDELYPYIGRLDDNLTFENRVYIERTVRDLRNKLAGFLATKDFKKSTELQGIIARLEDICKGDCRND